MAGPSPVDRRDVVQTLAAEAPLSFVAGTRALSAWLQEPDDAITLLSGTGRDVSLYVGPGRRYFGDPADPLEHGRGRVALIMDRHILPSSPSYPEWRFAPFDVGEVLYHWNEGSLPREYLSGGYSPERLRESLRPLDSLTKHFAQILDECYENPWDYFRPGQRPRPSLELEDLTAAVYRASTDRWFGRVRSFSGALTFEIRSARAIHVPKSSIIALVLLDDDLTRKVAAADTNRLVATFGERVRIVPTPREITHPDLPSVLIESETTLVVCEYLQSKLATTS